MKADGSGKTQLSPGAGFSPASSPDRKQIVHAVVLARLSASILVSFGEMGIEPPGR